VSQVSPAFDRPIQYSWQRCRSDYALNPAERRSPSYVALADLERRRKRTGHTYAIACAELAALGQILRGPIGVMLTDPDAVILSYAGERSFAPLARQFGLRPGAIWSECEQGTNGMGTCLAERAPIIIEQRQHFLRQNTALTCCAVPILNGTGELVAVLNASTLGSLSGAPTLALLELVARNIENRTLLETHRAEHFVLRFHEAREFVSTAAEGMVVIDTVGTIVASNRAALDMLGTGAYVSVCGRPSVEILDVDVPQLKHLVSQPSHHPQMLRYGPYFVQAEGPVESRMSALRGRERAGNALQEAERQALLAVLERHDGNVSRAAASLGLSRRTLHRKMQRHALRRDELV